MPLAQHIRPLHRDSQACYAAWRADPSPHQLNELVRALQPLAMRQARAWRRRYSAADPDDLASAALATLPVAVKKYDPAQGTPLCAYVSRYVTQALQGAVRKPVRRARLATFEMLGDVPTPGGYLDCVRAVDDTDELLYLLGLLFRGLSPHNRELLSLYYLREQSTDAIAVHYGWASAQYACHALDRARQAARKLVNAHLRHARSAQASALLAYRDSRVKPYRRTKIKIRIPPRPAPCSPIATKAPSRRRLGAEEAYRMWRHYPSPQTENLVVGSVAPFIAKYARKYQHRSQLPFEDLMQVGNAGLAHAMHRYDPAHHVTFLTYAGRCITGMIQNAANKERQRSGHTRNCAPLLDSKGEDSGHDPIRDLRSREIQPLERVVVAEDIERLRAAIERLPFKAKVFARKFIAGGGKPRTSCTASLMANYAALIDKLRKIMQVETIESGTRAGIICAAKSQKLYNVER